MVSMTLRSPFMVFMVFRLFYGYLNETIMPLHLNKYHLKIVSWIKQIKLEKIGKNKSAKFQHIGKINWLLCL